MDWVDPILRKPRPWVRQLLPGSLLSLLERKDLVHDSLSKLLIRSTVAPLSRYTGVVPVSQVVASERIEEEQRRFQVVLLLHRGEYECPQPCVQGEGVQGVPRIPCIELPRARDDRGEQ